MQHRYQIHLYFDGDAYIANVPELPDCKGRGQSYADALQHAQYAISVCLEAMRLAGKTPPVPIAFSAALQQFCRTKRSAAVSDNAHSAIKARLQQKFGILSNRELAARLGVIAADAPIMLSTALAGNGTRHVRCAIALALGELPSRLWPARSAALLQGDDDCYRRVLQETERGAAAGADSQPFDRSA